MERDNKILLQTLLEPNDIDILPQHRLKIAQTNLIPAVCFYNGTFIPIHAGHLGVLLETKKYIESLGTYELLGAYICPSHSGYAANKLPPEDIIGVGHRLAMIELAIEKLDWVMIDTFEVVQPSISPLSVTMRAFISRVRSQLPNGSQIDVFWLKGDDTLLIEKSFDHIIQFGLHNVYILNRGCHDIAADNNGTWQTMRDYHQAKWQSVRNASSFPDRFHLIQAEHMNLSSSGIRKCARHPQVTWDQLQPYVQIDRVTTYILQHRLWSAPLDPLHSTVSNMANFPEEISDLTPELLSSMLSTSTTSPIKVISFMCKRIGEGKGWSGFLYRIQYANPRNDHLPERLIIKLSSGILMEHEFYRTLAPCISNIEIPKCYFIGRNPHCPRQSLLLLEDLSLNYQPLDDKHSLTDSNVLFLVASAACLHAEFFNHPLLHQQTYAWLSPLSASVQHYQAIYVNRMADPTFRGHLESNLSPKAYVYSRALVSHIPHIFEALSDGPYTLTHGDFWINNMFVRRGESYRMILFDWQTCCRANGLIDVVFFIRLLGGVRARSLEPQVLQLYHQTLVKYGISQYDLERIQRDYYSLALPFMLVFHTDWKVIQEKHYKEIIMLLEDIVTFGMQNDRMKCDCHLPVWRS